MSNNVNLEAIQRLALAAVENRPWEYTYRFICRWFSQTYATPLQTVEYDLDPEYVLQHYYEFSFLQQIKEANHPEASAGTKEEWDKMRSTIIRGYAKAAEEDEIIAVEEENWDTDLLAQIAEEEAKRAKKQQSDQPVADNGGGMLDIDPNDPNLLFGSDEPVDDTPPDY